MGTSANSKIIRATKEKIYKAFSDKNALELWLAPDEMIRKIHEFDFRVGGGYMMSLFDKKKPVTYVKTFSPIC